MKKIFGMIAALCLVLAFMGCASAPSASAGMQSAKNGAPNGVLVGMATGKDASTSATGAKNQLIRGMVSMSRNIIQDAASAGEISTEVSSGLLQGVANALSRSSVSGAVRQGQGTGRGNVTWTVMYLEKSAASSEINRALAAAKQITPGSESFSINSRFDAEFAKAAARDWSN